jgi:glutamate dehydrogenase/leucine dehydrogenase
VADPKGLDVPTLIALKDSGGRLADNAAGRKLDRDAILDVACEIWIPAARPDVLRADTVDRLDTKLVAQGANIPATPEAEQRLHARGVLVLPDFIANAGGVICASVEYHGGSESAALAVISEKIGANIQTILAESLKAGVLPRAAAVALARRRVEIAMAVRRFH